MIVCYIKITSVKLHQKEASKRTKKKSEYINSEFEYYMLCEIGVFLTLKMKIN